MPPRRRNPTKALLPGCIFPPEIMQRITSFYVPLFQDPKEGKGYQIIPLLQTCKTIRDMTVPILYEEVTLVKASQLVRFMDPSQTPSSFFPLIREIFIQCSWTPEEKSGGSRHDRPRKLQGLRCLTWKVGACLREVIFALEPETEVVQNLKNVTIKAPWIPVSLKAHSMLAHYRDQRHLGHLITISETLGVDSSVHGLLKYARVADSIPDYTPMPDDEIPEEVYDLGDWEGPPFRVLQVHLQDPDDQTEKIATNWAKTKRGVELVIDRSTEGKVKLEDRKAPDN